MNTIMKMLSWGLGVLESVGQWLGLLVLRLVLAWEFGEAGWMKWQGENWFADIQDQFPFPFNLVPVSLSWTLATWSELLGAVALLLGLGTRFFSLSLMVLTVVAIAAVHWPAEWHGLAQLMQGYVLTDDGHGHFKLPVLFLVMLLPLLCFGPGRLSLDHVLRCRILKGRA